MKLTQFIVSLAIFTQFEVLGEDPYKLVMVGYYCNDYNYLATFSDNVAQNCYNLMLTTPACTGGGGFFDISASGACECCLDASTAITSVSEFG